ncbi:8057_t:CDS:2 [Diversispora eburnea]|uniref:8057_t:CDS:1 n=1 Tax=Diversispora eburnea TaxID=1213867 RepID=A0A9N8WTU3_9GLOM|nr:8057_t:CDS:2 [Diversispora eburnea]
MCTIQGANIVSPKIRIPIYVQSSLIILKVFAEQSEIIKSALFGSATLLTLIISTIIQYHTNNLHYLFQLEVTYLVVLLLIVTCYAFINPATLPKNKTSSVLGLIVSLVSLLTICYCIWLWATIRWKLPGQECGDKVMFFWLKRSLNPTGWVRDFMLAVLAIPTLVLVIVSAEILLQRNPISEIQGNWNVEGIIILIMAGGDAISTIFLLLKTYI